MFKERVLLGQYYPVASPVHRLTAQTKIIVTLLYMVTLFMVNDWFGWGGMAAIFLVTVILSRVPVSALWRGLKVIAIFCALTVILNFFLYPGDTVLWHWRSLTLSLESISYGFAMGLRLLLLVAFASLLTLTTKPLELTDGLERVLKPLRYIKVPAHEIAMMMSIALRFIPTILEEFDRIILAQKARGAKIGKGKLLQRISVFVPLLVPLFVASFRRAEDLAQAMEAKCYCGGEGRTKWKVVVWKRADTLTLVVFGCFLVLSIVERVLL